MAEVIPIDDDLVTPVYERLLVRLNPALGRDRWLRLFRHGWGPADEPTGYVLRVNREVVGFAGCVRSRQPIDGRDEDIRNLTSWIVDDPHRRLALALIMPILRDPECTVTNLTPLASVNAMFLRLGFSELEGHLRILPLWRALRPAGGCRVAWDPGTVASALTPRDRQTFADHRALVGHLAFVRDAEAGLVLYALTRRRGLPTARLYHVGRPALFREGWRVVARALFRRHGRLLLEVDDRLVPDPPAASRRVPLVPSRLYRSPRLRPHQVSNAYSELPLLGL